MASQAARKRVSTQPDPKTPQPRQRTQQMQDQDQGEDQDKEATPRPRARMVAVKPLPKGFRIVRDKAGGEVKYEAGATEMDARDVDHWYAIANGAERA